MESPKPQTIGSDLGVEQRGRNQFTEVINDLDVLAGGVEYLGDAVVAHQSEERSKIQTLRQGVDNESHIGPGHLDYAQFGPESGFPQEFRINRYVVVGCKTLTGFGEIFCFCNHMHGETQL